MITYCEHQILLIVFLLVFCCICCVTSSSTKTTLKNTDKKLYIVLTNKYLWMLFDHVHFYCGKKHAVVELLLFTFSISTGIA